MKTPWFDRESGTWVDKDEFDNENKKETESVDAEIEAAKKAVSDVSTKPLENTAHSFAQSLTINEDDMPF
jgi:hypothetical protein